MAAIWRWGAENPHFAPSGAPREPLERGAAVGPAPRSGKPGGRAAGRRLGDLGQIVGQDAPADPAAHPAFPMIAATVQLKARAQHADPPFDPRPKPKAAPPPAGPFLLP